MKFISFVKKLSGANCCQMDEQSDPATPKVLVVGSPNVGKSLLFNRLTGRYVTVSNYPGTTVDVARGVLKTENSLYEVVDTPGMYSLSPITDEERVTFSLLMNEKVHVIIHVIDEKNIQRMLGLTLQLIEMGQPLILALNMADEAKALGIRIDIQKLWHQLGIPVVETVATTGRGFDELIHQIKKAQPAKMMPMNYGSTLEQAISAISQRLDSQSPTSARIRALMLLQEDAEEVAQLRRSVEPSTAAEILRLVLQARVGLQHSVHYHATLALNRHVEKILKDCAIFAPTQTIGFREQLSLLLMRPLVGVPVLLLVLYFGLYKFVGSFGAGFLVDFLQETVFKEHIHPPVEWAVRAIIPWPVLQELFIGQYGIITLGVRYAVAIILPIVGTFFLAFSIIEDSGYLPRLAMLIDRVFKKIGLNGRAVIPIVLGFGCDTMATMVTRTLETKREKLIATLLLALAIPCSAQLGVILALLAGKPYALGIWAGFIIFVFFVTGFLMAKLVPGERPSFYMELPPLRMPKLGNVAAKTYSRVVWYFKEVFPLFILASIFIWLGRVTGLFQLAIKGLTPVVNLIGLPDETAVAFLFGFFRRDYGAAGLYDLQNSGVITGNQLAVAAITLTLFLPCIAQFLIMKKERGWKMTLLSSTSILVLAFIAGFFANSLFNFLGVRL